MPAFVSGVLSSPIPARFRSSFIRRDIIPGAGRLIVVALLFYRRLFPLLRRGHSEWLIDFFCERWFLGSSRGALLRLFQAVRCLNSRHRWPKGCCTSERTLVIWGCIRIRFHRGWSWGSLGPCIRVWPLKTVWDCWTRTSCHSRWVLFLGSGYLWGFLLANLKFWVWRGCFQFWDLSVRCYFLRVVVELWLRLVWCAWVHLDCVWFWCKISDSGCGTFFSCCSASFSVRRGRCRGSLRIFSRGSRCLFC